MEKIKFEIIKSETENKEAVKTRPFDELLALARNGQDIVRLCLAKDENTPEKIIEEIALNDPNEDIRRMARKTKTNIFLSRFE